MVELHRERDMLLSTRLEREEERATEREVPWIYSLDKCKYILWLIFCFVCIIAMLSIYINAKIPHAEKDYIKTEAELVEANLKLKGTEAELVEAKLKLKGTEVELVEANLKLKGTEGELVEANFKLKEFKIKVMENEQVIQHANKKSHKKQKQEDLAKMTEFEYSKCDVRENANGAFSNIFEKKSWVKKKFDNDGLVHSVSGDGSDPQEMTNWMTMLSKIIYDHNITTVCDIPCGDANWQFGSKLLNTIDTYVGGDIVNAVIQQNQKYYEAHCNKYFIHWDLVNCPIPTHFINKCQKTKIVEHFDLIILKDVIQHVSAKDGQKMLKNIVSSGAKYLILSSYPCDKTKLQSGVKDGSFYRAGLDCPPFNLPSPNKPLPSHANGKEPDLIFFYEINEEFKSIVSNWDKN